MKNIIKKFLTTKTARCVILLTLVFQLTGCVYLLVGGVGALGGYIVSPDTVEGLTQNDSQDVWDASVEVLSVMGLIEEQQEEAGVIVAKVANCKVTINISSLSATTTKISVKARKKYFPKISTAQDVFVKIMSQVNE